MKQNDIWDDFRTAIARGYACDGLPDEFATEMAEKAVVALNAAFGGMRGYLPQTMAAARRAARASFDGRNHETLARQFGVHSKTIRTWVR